ncbi:f-box and wd-40 domain-containing protein cdc4 [Fusarium flagelliforme]|uniref:F-box and wd-40 domain-containing protein cdc4 n=1 Tax=Fusarium flagelliforme TaxID=2675880 RepID=A0A395MI87_9HYPO|nr:f-box and wd-40 domain-containing protein cdc4 [Fusarium flagelliforme]
MESSGQLSLKDAPFTATLSERRVVITALHIGDGFLLVTSASGFVYRVDLVTESVEVLAQVKDVWSLACLDSSVIFGSLNGEIHVLDINNRANLNSVKAHDSAVRCLAILESGIIVSGSRDSTIRLWTLESGKLEPRNVLRGHTAEVRNVQVHGDVIVSGSYDADARVWSAQTGECLHILRGHGRHIHGLAFDGKRVATSSTDGDIRVWDSETGPRELASSDGNGTAISAIKVQGRHVIAGTTGGSVKIIDRQSCEMLHSWTDGTCGIAVFQVGFTLEHSPFAVYLKDESVLVTVF